MRPWSAASPKSSPGSRSRMFPPPLLRPKRRPHPCRLPSQPPIPRLFPHPPQRPSRRLLPHLHPRRLLPRSPRAPLSEEAVGDILRQRLPEAVLKELELDEDDGRWIYEAKLRHGDLKYEIELDAFTGEILKWEEDDWNASRLGRASVGPAPQKRGCGFGRCS